MKKVVIGGTFDLFHKGHESLIKKGLELGDLYIGLTSNEMAQRMKNRQIEDFSTRKKNLENYVIDELNRNVEIREIEDLYGFAVEEDLDYIIVSPETESNAELINNEREKNNKNKLEIVKIDFILAKDDKPISSTRINNKEIDREGNLVS